MLKTTLKPRLRAVGSKKAVRFAALAFFSFLVISPTQGQTNVNEVSGIAYGTNYLDLAITNSIESVADGEGSLNIEYAGTTNLTLDHEISGFIVVNNQTTNFSIAATPDALVTGSGGPALTAINSTNLSLTGGRYVGTVATAGDEFPQIPGADGTALGGLLRNSKVTIDGSEFTGAAGYAGMVVQSSEVEVTDGTFIGGAGAAGLFAASNSFVTINSGSFTGFVGVAAVQIADLTINDGMFNGSDGVAGLLAISNQTVTINGGSFSGGEGGVGVLAISNQMVTINGGSFIGGDDAEGLYAENSDLITIGNGTFTVPITSKTFQVFGPSFEPFAFMVEAPGAFVCLGLMLCLMNMLGKK